MVKEGEDPGSGYPPYTAYGIFSVVSQYRHTDAICASEVGCQAACRPQKRQRAESRGGGGGSNVDMKEVSNVALARHPKHDKHCITVQSTMSDQASKHPLTPEEYFRSYFTYYICNL